MTKYYLTLSLMLLGLCAWGRTLSPEEALSRAASDNGVRRVAAKAKANPKLVYTASTESGDPAVYVFADNKSGYMILSADDVAYPVLGYADHGTPDADNMAPSMRWWLGEYARQIAWAKSHGLAYKAAPAPKAGRRDVPAMIKTAWDQGAPYNQLCPVVNAERAYTGCVATSMSQIMYYFQYPAVGKGKISYNDSEGCGKRLSWNFAEHPFKWDEMLLTYTPGKYTDAQGYAVAELMKSAGASVKMSYGADASGALSMLTASSLVKYFDYDPNLEYSLRSYMSTTLWDEKMYDNIANVGPVLYGGASMLGGGHSFIVDGYQAETGFYHFNWGWSEMSDGYYSLDALNPSSLGAGGGEGGGYNFTQDGVFGIQPPTGKPANPQVLRLTQQGTLGGTVTGSQIKLSIIEESQPMWINYTPYDLDVIFGVSIQEQGDSKLAADTVVVPLSKPISMLAGYGAQAGVCNKLDLSTLDLADGKYTVTMTSLITNRENQTWQPVQQNYGYSNSFTLTKSGSKYEITTVPGAFYSVDEIALEYELYYGCLAKIHYKITNHNDIEISRGIAPMLYTTDQQPAFLGNSKLVTLQPGETAEGVIVTEWVPLSQQTGTVYDDTEFLFTLFDETSYRIMADQILGKVTMHGNPGMPTITMMKPLAIKGAELVDGVYQVTDPSNMELSARVMLRKGVIAYPMYAVILEEPDKFGNAAVIDYVGENVFMFKDNSSYDFQQTYNFKSAVPGKTYCLSLALGVGSSLAPLVREIPFVVVDNSGIDDIEAVTPDVPVEYYNLQGLRVDYESAPAGVYIRRQGNDVSKVLKK